MIGIGSPQYRWREKTQSRSLKFTFGSPFPFSASQAVIFFFASSTERLSSMPELTITPVSQSVKASSFTFPPLTTSTMGRPNFLANSQSRVSCAGTAMIAPVP
jgi:hypothetical protein